MENYILANDNVQRQTGSKSKTKTGDKVFSRCVLREDNFAILL